MATTIKGKMKRQIRLHTVKAPVIITVTENGLEMAVAGYRTKVFGSWETIARALQTPANVPSYLADKPLEMLKQQADKLTKKVKEEAL